MAQQAAVQPAELAPPSDDAPSPLPRRHSRWAAYLGGAIVLVSLVVTIPLAMGSIVRQLFLPPTKTVYVLSPGVADRAARATGADATSVTVAVIAIDEARQLATLRISGHRSCGGTCAPFRLLFVALEDADGEGVGLPPSATVDVAAEDHAINQNIELPVEGQPSLYPFDQYSLTLGVVKIPATGTSPSAGTNGGETADDVYLALESQLSKYSMSPPSTPAPDAVTSGDPAYNVNRAVALAFRRPLYLQVLSGLLVLLMMAAVLLVVILEPIRRLLVEIGSLVLGVWGMRSILMAGAPPVITAVDLTLTAVILVLLYGIAIRMILVLHEGGWGRLHELLRDGG